MRWILAVWVLLWATTASADPASDITVNVLDTQTLNALESSGNTLSEALGGPKAVTTADAYRSNAAFRDLADTIGRPLPHDAKSDQLPDTIPAGAGDIPDMVRLIRNFEDKGRRSEKDSKGGFFIRHLSNNSQYPYAVEYDGDEPRHFDTRWLNSTYGEMKLIAIVNRMDKVDFDPSSCGEVRYIYRLSYHTPKSGSSLPFFLNVVKHYPRQADCTAFAKRWIGLQTAERLRQTTLKDLTFKQVELNFQSLRFTSGYMHDFGGQAMYMQRIFRFNGAKLEPIALENTPDVQAIGRNPALLTRFVDWLKQGDRLARLDNGTLVIDIDPAFLTKLSVSWSTLGRARTANKPFSRLFQGKQALLDGIDISGLRYIRSKDALVERLNNLTCMGCHQSGGTAGFHMLGYADDRYSHHFNRQQLPMSPHAYAETVRRTAYVTALATGKKPNTFRPHSDFTAADWQQASVPAFTSVPLGGLCTTSSSFAGAPSCAAGLACQQTVTSSTTPVLFGECVKKGGRAASGAVCWKGDVREVTALPQDRGPIPSFNLFAFQDKWKFDGSAYSENEVSNLKCVLPQSGAPLGRASRKCTLAEENLEGISASNAVPGEICANQGGNGFDLCAASGNSGACLESRVVRGMLDTCAPSRPCREDYICQKLPDYDRISAANYGNTKNGVRVNLSSPDRINGSTLRSLQKAETGFCVPTYFLFNMRLDGHPSPVTGAPPGEPRIERAAPVRGYR